MPEIYNPSRKPRPFSMGGVTRQAKNYNPQRIEKRWQRIWGKAGIYKIPDRVKGKKNFYHLVMFPYPSGDLHIGHWYNFVGGDVFARFKRFQGYNVMSPMGFDAFGLPAENAAIRHRIHPRKWTYKNIKTMKKQIKTIGAVYDWEREVVTCNPEYYKWTQWLFLEFFKKGLAYKKKAPANWCPRCRSILANEQAEEGKCWRCEGQVEQKELEQWFFKITDYAEDLLSDLKDLDYNPSSPAKVSEGNLGGQATRQGKSIDWPEKTKIMQKNWIGRSEGATIKFQISNFKFQIEVFTTRPDTLFGCTYLVLAPEHPFVASLLKIKNQKSKIKNIEYVRKYIEESKKKTERERISEIREKTGIEIKGVKAINPVNNREIPIFVADYVLIHYGTGAIMAVPAHDQRDLDFARKYNLPMIEVIKPYQEKKELPKKAPSVASNGRFDRAYEGEGILVNSGRFDGMDFNIAKERIVDWLAKKDLAKKAVYYKIRDWLISRQRYWGAPIPLVFCGNCAVKIKNQKSKIKNFDKGELLNPGWIAVPEKDLPVLLPSVKDYLPTAEGKSPLAKAKKFIETNCPKCQGPAQRETDTMDTFVCSSWYYLAYAFWHKLGNQKSKIKNQKLNKENIFIKYKNLIKAWLPVNIYIGGAEHAVLHFLYSRFFTKVLKKLGHLHFSEPFLSIRHQGIILGSDGQKMSKSRGNVVDPDVQVKKYGSDAVRMHLCFMGPYEQGGPWQPKGIVGICRFLQKICKLFNEVKNYGLPNEKFKMKNEKLQSKINKNNLERLIRKTIKKVTEDIENFRFNTAISALMILVNEIQHAKSAGLAKASPNANAPMRIKNFEILLKLLAPFAPHLTEELWQGLKPDVGPLKEFEIKDSIHSQPWPKYDPRLIKEEKITLVIQINGRVRDKIEVEADISEKKAKELVLAREKIKKWTAGKEIRKVIFVPGRLINLVI